MRVGVEGESMVRPFDGAWIVRENGGWESAERVAKNVAAIDSIEPKVGDSLIFGN